jgi:hypothetical protein
MAYGRSASCFRQLLWLWYVLSKGLGCQDRVLTEFSGGANSHVVVSLTLITPQCNSSSMHLSGMFRSHEHSILTICACRWTILTISSSLEVSAAITRQSCPLESQHWSLMLILASTLRRADLKVATQNHRLQSSSSLCFHPSTLPGCRGTQRHSHTR